MSGQVRQGELDPQLRDQFQQTINISTGSGLADAFGTISYAAPIEVLARVEEDRQVIESQTGNERTTTHRICTEGRRKDNGNLIAFGMRTRFWLPGDDPSNSKLAREPAGIYDGVDEFGSFSHFEVLV
ncbi:hypothetical protein LCGC14_2017090 [marine sediment metagenome]|uniref:Uncharacterized protein n=1 Tax=marine sediment metagenome TaxID=412755 RepID=A0A0F9EYN9_9ZZZZ